MHKLIGIRTAEIAFDTIDKVDRNLFERYCDVQVWATFGKIIACPENPSEENQCKKNSDLISQTVEEERKVNIFPL